MFLRDLHALVAEQNRHPLERHTAGATRPRTCRGTGVRGHPARQPGGQGAERSLPIAHATFRIRLPRPKKVALARHRLRAPLLPKAAADTRPRSRFLRCKRRCITDPFAAQGDRVANAQPAISEQQHQCAHTWSIRAIGIVVASTDSADDLLLGKRHGRTAGDLRIFQYLRGMPSIHPVIAETEESVHPLEFLHRSQVVICPSSSERPHVSKSSSADIAQTLLAGELLQAPE